jgi:PAS domain S-box-containing protein
LIGYWQAVKSLKAETTLEQYFCLLAGTAEPAVTFVPVMRSVRYKVAKSDAVIESFVAGFKPDQRPNFNIYYSKTEGLMSIPPDPTTPGTSTPAQYTADPFRLLVESVNDYAIFMLDPAGNVTSWNSGAERLKGYRSEEVIGRHCSLFYLAEDVAAGKPQIVLQQALVKGSCEEEGQRLRKDGTTFWALVTVTALFDPSDDHLGFAEVIRDITEKRRHEQALRKQTEASLQASEARYQTLFEYAKVGIVLADARSFYIDANPSACRMFGYRHDEFIGLHASDIVVQTEVTHIESALSEINAQSDHQREWQFRRKDGSVFSADVTATKMPDGTLLGIIRDLSDRKRANDYREHLAAIVESSSDAIIGQDLNSTITSWNAGAEAIFGYVADEMIGTSITQLMPDDNGQEEAIILESLRLGERVEIVETLRQTRDGRLIDVSVTISPIRDASGQIIGASKIARDITAQKEREHEIARISRLYAALSEINQAIVWMPTRDELFRKVCQVLVEHGGFHMAWIGWHAPGTDCLVPVAECGDENGYLQSINVYTDERPEGQGPSGKTLRSGRPYICNDMLNDPTTLLWRSELERRGFLACAVFPIRMNGAVRGTLSIYADKREFFHDKEIALLEEAANDLSFALDNYARDEARRQAEQTVRNEKLFSDTMIESMPGILYLYDSNGRFLRWNQNFETVSGYSGEEIAGMHPRDFFSDEEKPRVEQRIAEVFANGDSSVEASFVAKDGNATPYFFTGRHVMFEGTSCLIGVGIDISDRRHAEDQLAESEQKYRELVEYANSIILRWNSDGRITFLNEFGQRFFGYSGEEILGRRVIDTIVPPSESGGRDLEQLIEIIRATPEAFEQNINENIRRNGERVWIAWANRIVRDWQGQVVEFLSIGTDITDRMRIEAERERRHRAEAADHIKSAFLATMSHELRTPLNSIIGFTGIMLQGLAGPLNPEQSKQLGMVRTSARHLLALVNDVLDISKIEAGQIEVAREPFDLRRSITKVITLVVPQAEAKQLELRVQLAPELGEAVGDERRFEQILLNLLSNAVKFTEHGEIVLTAGLITDFKLPDATLGQPAICLEVADTGMGIKTEDLPTLFQPFRQIDAGLSRTHEGTGLGLAICHRLVDLMGGEISAESEWGKGSTFSITLPLQRQVKS